MIYLLKRALGFVFMGIEDFGIALVEALASGTPLIALNQGGAKEIMKDSFQGVFVKAQTRQSLEEALLEFEKKSFDYQKIQESVAHFSKERFKKEFKSFVDNRFLDFLSHRSSN
jgi:glycosyltransferase involved in cell wall biosynthesis